MKIDIIFIESKIGYIFKQKSLLLQAFTRDSYSNEHPDVPNNEVLEFIGDSYISVVITKKLIELKSKVDVNGLICSLNEKDFTNLKQMFVQKKSLSSAIDKLDLIKFIRMSIGDHKEKVENKDSVKEDLFEAIVGAVSIDCEYNFPTIETVILKMLDIQYNLEDKIKEYEENYVGKLQEWYQKNRLDTPKYITDNEILSNGTPNWTITLILNDQVFTTRDVNQKSARQQLAKNVIQYLKDNDMYSLKKKTLTFTLDRAINKLQELSQMKMISKPVYTENELSHNTEKWEITCKVDSVMFKALSKTKTDAKKKAAHMMLMYLKSNDLI